MTIDTIYSIGIAPPPTGGVATHIVRMQDYTLQRGLKYIIYDESGTKKQLPNVVNSNIFKLFGLFFKPKGIVHNHLFSLPYCLVALFLSFRHTSIFSLHNETFWEVIGRYGLAGRKFYKYFFIRMKAVAVPNKNAYSIITRIVPTSKVKLIPAFIALEETKPIKDTELLGLRKKHRFLFSSYTHQFDIFKGVDLYGMDMLIDLTAILKEKNYDVATIVTARDLKNTECLKEFEDVIKKKNIESHFFFNERPIDAMAFWKISDVFMRTTNTDGNSVSVLEALSVGTPVIATDCVERPTECILVKTRNMDDLLEKTIYVLENLESEKKKLTNSSFKGYAEDLYDVYESLVKEG